ncbi:Tpo1p [Sugiyamaella lignohabitans]|uniref:Tpo1p n=1 Tax=Sugiyamaella lignohabitans TaxID=796027 RepID=A0A167D679_9ASCO|nr:Tpo1p [Sugiyamaella lignohabitans]ANB12532.1 Tpo1p [Sugiyamaella lignohabitans]
MIVVEDDSISEEVVSMNLAPVKRLDEKDDSCELDDNGLAESTGIAHRVFSATHRGQSFSMGGGKPLPPLPALSKEAYRVDYEGPDDPYHPYNWPSRRKLVTYICLVYTSLCVTMGSAVYSPASEVIAKKYNVGSVVTILGTSVYILGFASGPVVWGPISENKFGRKSPSIVSIFLFTIFSFGAAVSKDLQTLIICRFFAGLTGSAPWAVVVASFSDLYDNSHRGKPIIVFMFVTFMGPLVGPIVGAFLTNSNLGWRWTQYISGIMGAVALIVDILFVEETYHPLLLAYKAKALRKATGNWAIYAAHEEKEINLNDIVTKTVARPIVMLFTEPILLLISVYTAFIYGILYLFLEAYPIVFAGYGLTGGVEQLPYFALVIGLGIASLSIAYILDPQYRKKLLANGGKPVPEARLPAMIYGGIAFPIGIFWFTWTGNYPQHIHWIVPTLSGMFTGYSLLAIFQPAISYLVEAYPTYAASALAAATFVRSSFGATFPLFAGAMFHNLGINWAGTVIGCLGLIMVPVPILFLRYGQQIRARSKFGV